jgi:hypothetical protein
MKIVIFSNNSKKKRREGIKKRNPIKSFLIRFFSNLINSISKQTNNKKRTEINKVNFHLESRIDWKVMHLFAYLIVSWLLSLLLLFPVSLGVNFINVLQAVFTKADPERAKETIKLSVFL